jgi:hypothetical protein
VRGAGTGYRSCRGGGIGRLGVADGELRLGSCQLGDAAIPSEQGHLDRVERTRIRYGPPLRGVAWEAGTVVRTLGSVKMIVAGLDHVGHSTIPVPRSPGTPAAIMPSGNAARDYSQERRQLALHEAGHYVVSAYFGIRDIQAHISPHQTSDPSERAWNGQTHCRTSELDRLSLHRRRMIAVAGKTAEEAWSHRGMDYDPWWVCVFQEPDSLSSGDWEGTRCRPGHPDRALIRAADEVWALLAPRDGILWEPLVRISRLLMRARWIGPDFVRTVPRRRPWPRSTGEATLPN